MVGAITTFDCSRTRCFKYSAMRKSFFSFRCGPCSLLSAPSGMTTTVSGVSIFSASIQVRSLSRIPFICDCLFAWPGVIDTIAKNKRGIRKILFIWGPFNQVASSTALLNEVLFEVTRNSMRPPHPGARRARRGIRRR